MTITKRTIKRLRTVASKLEKVSEHFDYYDFIGAEPFEVDSTLDLTEEQGEEAYRTLGRILDSFERKKKAPARRKGMITPAQKEYAEQLFGQLGWDRGPRWWGFIQKQIGRKCTLDMLMNREASKVITGLERLVASGQSAVDSRQNAKGKSEKGAR